MTRRKRHKALRAAIFAPAPFAALYVWRASGEPTIDYRPAIGAALAVAAGLLLWPPVILAGAAVATVPHLLVPRQWRVTYRHAHGRDGARSAYIPAHLRKATLHADRHACLYCGARTGLQIDHITPWAAGGSTWFWNLAVLCARCNRVKSNYWHKTPGMYRPFPGADDPRLAAKIEAKERRHRLNPFRMARAAWGLAA